MATKKNKKLTPKEKAFVEAVLNKPRMPRSHAVVEAGYNVTTGNSARQLASELMKKPHIQSKLQNYTDLVESTLVNTVKEWGDHEKPRQREIAIQSAQYIHDKVHGKAKQSLEVQSTKVTIGIDLTGTLADSPQ